MEIFQPIPPPHKQAKHPINRYASWYTWSANFLKLCQNLEQEAQRVHAPRFIHLRGGKPYDYTFSLDPSVALDEGLVRDLKPFVEDLYHLPASNSIILFDAMLGKHLSGRGLHLLFAFFRDALASLAGDPMNALYAPLRGTQNKFPVHSDLYVPQILFNIFDDVPADSSGATLFLSAEEFTQLLPKVRSLPATVREKIVQILHGDSGEDHYDEFYGLLYLNVWTKELVEKMKPKLLRVKLYSGQGYLIDDRVWLHGRERVKGGVSQKRLHRLIFNTRLKQSPSSPTNT